MRSRDSGVGFKSPTGYKSTSVDLSIHGGFFVQCPINTVNHDEKFGKRVKALHLVWFKKQPKTSPKTSPTF